MAIESFDRALANEPLEVLLPAIWYDKGGAFQALRRLKDAMYCYDKVIALQTNAPDAL